ncbi:uncharacterized protein [Miscanthus floridulus]|uniref:uncharacterized protein n=2 Tax=Miscanthus floridulus TaxID=154761 RepID=UPI003457778B
MDRDRSSRRTRDDNGHHRSRDRDDDRHHRRSRHDTDAHHRRDGGDEDCRRGNRRSVSPSESPPPSSKRDRSSSRPRGGKAGQGIRRSAVTSTPSKVHKAVDACKGVLRGLHSSRIVERELDRAKRTLLMKHEAETKTNAWLGLLAHLQSSSVPRKVLVIVVLLKMIMRRRFSIIQWEALALLLIGISVNQLKSLPEGSSALGLPVAAGAYLYTLFFVTVPALASVYNEKALKSQFDTSIYLQNLFLYGYGAIFNFLGLVITAIIQGNY